MGERAPLAAAGEKTDPARVGLVGVAVPELLVDCGADEVETEVVEAKREDTEWFNRR
jgi:hypothetical protein